MRQTISLGESDDPPDSLYQEKKILIAEPEKKRGSFLVAASVTRAIAKGEDEAIASSPTARAEIISDISRCFELWQEFSPKGSLFDTWEFRLAFYHGYGYEPYFLLLKNEKENLAILPLWYENNNWYDKNKKRYTWFGSDWQEEVRFFTKDPKYIPILLSAAPSPLYLNAIAADSIEPIKKAVGIKEDQQKYILHLGKFKNHEDFLMTLKKNKRRDLRKDRNRILRQNPEIIINNFADLKELINVSKKRFQEKGEDTDWEDPRRIKTFEEVIRLGGRSYETRMITVKINGKVAGVDLVCLYNKTYYAVKCGYDVKNFSGIGNFMNVFEIDDAISLGMEKIDFLQNNYEWKDRWFEAVPLFEYEK